MPLFCIIVLVTLCQISHSTNQWLQLVWRSSLIFDKKSINKPQNVIVDANIVPRWTWSRSKVTAVMSPVTFWSQRGLRTDIMETRDVNDWINCPQLLKWDFGESWGHSMLCWDLHFKKMLFLFEAADRRTVRDSNMNVLSESKCYSISTALEVEYNGTAFVLSALVWVECTVALETLLSSVSKDFLSLSANWELNFRDAPLWFTVIWPAVIYLHHITDNLRRENRSC